MSAFEVNLFLMLRSPNVLLMSKNYVDSFKSKFVVTPTRVRNARKLTENREPTIVSLGAFTAKAIVTFEDVPVTKSAKRFIVIQNPVNEEITVSF